jgi:hypothetical protein
VLASILGCGIVLLVTRREPFVRVWLFLLPVYLALAGAGISLMVGPLNRRVGARIHSLIVIALAVGLSVWGGYSVHRAEVVLLSHETGRFPDAESIALFLANELELGDVVLASIPANGTLEYYFGLHGIPSDYFWTSDRASAPSLDSGQLIGRVLAVVDHDRDVDPSGLLARLELQIGPTTSSHVVRRFDESTVYEFSELPLRQ